MSNPISMIVPVPNSKQSAVFDRTSNEWTSHREMTMIFLHGIQKHLNQVLNYRGHVFLNEVYDALGIRRTSEGAILGWLADSFNVIDFGAFDHTKYVINEDGYFHLTFHTDGVIFDQI